MVVELPQHGDWIYVLVRTPKGDWVRINKRPNDKSV